MMKPDFAKLKVNQSESVTSINGQFYHGCPVAKPRVMLLLCLSLMWQLPMRESSLCRFFDLLSD